MPRLREGNTVTRKSSAELAALRARLPKKHNACGHHAVNAADYYTEGVSDKVCVECYREGERERQKSYRAGRRPVSVPRYPDVEIDMGGVVRHAPKREVVHVVRKKHEGPHDVYDVLLVNAMGGLVCRKVGKTAQGHGRYADVCKTFGLSIRPFRPAVTFPSESAARVAETELAARVAADPDWKQVGREAFVPASMRAWGLVGGALAKALNETEVQAA